MNNGYLGNINKQLNKNGCNTYGMFGRPYGDGGDPSVVVELCEKNTDEIVEPGVRIRYTSAEDLTELTTFAIGGVAYIEDNGDGTYDLWSDDDCEFIALSDYFEMGITKVEVLNGGSLKYVFIMEDESTAPFANLGEMTEFIWNGPMNLESTMGMFYNCISLTSINLHTFDTSNVTDMTAMFDSCGGLTLLDVSNFDTSNVVDMKWVFANCISLPSIDLTNFDTSKVTNMESMFDGCESLTTIDVSNFNTSNAEDTGYMFKDCISLTSLDLTSFDTSNVGDMWYMFSGCAGLTSLDLTSFDTLEVVNMWYMFANCISLTSLDLTSFDTSDVVNMRNMFDGCTTLECITNLHTTSATNKTGMFDGCDALVQPDATAQTALMDVDGANWTNPGNCPPED